MESRMLKDKHILLFYPDFFGYGSSIMHAMKQLGAEVCYYNSKAVKRPIGKALFKIFPKVVLLFSRDYFKKIYETFDGKTIDHILVVERLPKWFLKKMKMKHPESAITLYMDDSIKNLKGISDNFDLFDRICSFDKNDVDNNDNIFFRPLFYSKSEKEVTETLEYKYDLCFIGTCHSDRFVIINKVKKQCQNSRNKVFNYLYLQSKFMFYFYKLTSKAFQEATIEDFSFTKMPYDENIDFENSSRAILDIQHPKQSGLTMRTIEMIGLKKKLVTTNDNIMSYDFYRPENICVVDRSNPVIDLKFLSTPYKELPDSIYKKYSLTQWVLDVFGVEG